MIQLVVGLGNPGPQYAAQRHNVGFWLTNRLAELLKIDFALEGKMLVAKTDTLRLAKPQSYMNLSGLPVRQLCDYFRISTEAVLVAHDDLDLPVGSMRIKRGGGHGGHNGLRDLIKHLGGDFYRLRIGIDHPGSRELVHNYVLGKPSLADKKTIEEAIEKVLTLRNYWLHDDIPRAQQLLHSH